MRTLENKTAVVTGGSRGIGHAIALAMAQEGANVAILYAGNREAAEKTEQEIAQIGGKVRAYQCDVSSFEETETVTKQILEEFGQVDILVNNAGIVRDGFLLSMKEEAFDDVINTNLKGAFHMIRHLYSHMMRKRSGRIINISSIVGLTGNAAQANYAAAKAGMIGLTKSTAKELAGRGVTCNAIAPGYIQSDMTDAMPEKAKEAIASQIPMKRTGLPQDVANLAVFLAGPGASYITGEVIRVDGGLAM
ncbi:3-oxoacyl-[acyl-carrier-protein] reductase [Anaeromassilibacillus sp. An200]|uniref:3-oxoacyl-[acyl-carrier-protein] reductase n=1 Tax=Candidatus Caccousia stercoris TaxID=2840723 RepID=A0A9D1FRE0_9FIRM|nr:3-oxoacyl-[acyl-carrier-protein] reductase [Anaeromassilibacillus sp. An200]OUP11343.1 3-oxoacyl-[acyl-carrier-protein] reductase [Anaeromassilibacillus sp. An200]HIS78646.1 3-oxoacyl-[acyl-carrier-protein] reductase [Candidatus Caccousia stercoris]